MPYEFLAFPVVVVVMTGSASDTNIAEYVVVGLVSVVAVEPVSASLVFWKVKNLIDVASRVAMANGVHGTEPPNGSVVEQRGSPSSSAPHQLGMQKATRSRTPNGDATISSSSCDRIVVESRVWPTDGASPWTPPSLPIP